ncbi:peptidylprolyl isomerase, partial [bacterium]
KEGKVLAEVNGKAITAEDFRKELERLPPYLKPMVQSAEGKKQLLDSMRVREIILEKAKKDGVDKSKEVADRLDDLRERLIVETYVKKKVEQEAKVSDEEMKKFYDENKEKFKSGEQVQASHILVKTEKEAQDILAQLKKGASFEELAKKYSTDSTAAKGGDLGWFSKGAMVPEFDKAAFGLKVGELSGIVKTQFGFHIIKVTGKRPAGVRTFDEVKEQIKANLLPAKQQEVFQKMQEDFKKDAKISIKEDALKDFNPDAAEPQGGAAAPQK